MNTPYINKMKKFLKKIKKNYLNKEMILPTIIGELIFWSPLIITTIFSLFNYKWWGAVTTIILFWSGPFTPGIPLQISLILLIKKIFLKIKKRSQIKWL